MIREIYVKTHTHRKRERLVERQRGERKVAERRGGKGRKITWSVPMGSYTKTFI